MGSEAKPALTETPGVSSGWGGRSKPSGGAPGPMSGIKEPQVMSSSLRRAAEKVGGGIAVVLALLVGLIAFAPSAFAHHSNATPTTCAPPAAVSTSPGSRRLDPGQQRHPPGHRHRHVPQRRRRSPRTTTASTRSNRPARDFAAVNGLGRFTLAEHRHRSRRDLVRPRGSDQSFRVVSTPLTTAPYHSTGPTATMRAPIPTSSPTGRPVVLGRHQHAGRLDRGHGHAQQGRLQAARQPTASAAAVCVTGQAFIQITMTNSAPAGGGSVAFQTTPAGRARLHDP